MSKGVNSSRSIISIFMLFGFLTILMTGLLSYVLRYNQLLSAVHTVFGLLFVGYGIFHLKNNLKPLISYIKKPKIKRLSYFCFLLIPLIVIGVAAGLPPFQTIVDIGYVLKEQKPIEREVTETIYTRITSKGRELSIDIKAGPHYSGPGYKVMGVATTSVPQMVVWIEDLDGNYIETLYVTKKASNSSYIKSLFATEVVRRPEALPHWSYSRGIESEDGLMAPSIDSPVADAITGATPLSSFELRSVTMANVAKVVIKLEVNRSFDYNEVYHQNAYPDNEVYSGSGNTAQPSLIYSTILDFEADQRYAFMELIGHGHYSGENGKIYTDMTGITTAKEIIQRIIIEKI